MDWGSFFTYITQVLILIATACVTILLVVATYRAVKDIRAKDQDQRS